MTARNAVRETIVATALGLAVAGCGGGGHTLPAPSNANPATSAATGTRGSATFTVTVPSAAQAAARRRAQYVSSQTASVRVDVQQSGAEVSGFPMTIPLTADSPNCTAGAGGTTCAFSVNVLPGTYTAMITTLDAAGNALSAAVAVPLSILPGTTTNVPLTLDGIVASLQIAPTASSAPAFISGTAVAGYALIGEGPRAFTITASDADGNTIVGLGAPSFSVALSGPVAFTLTPPVSATANTFTLAAPYSWASGSDKISVSVSYADSTPCASTGGACSTSVNVSMRELLFYNTNTQAQLFANGDTVPITTISQGIDSPSPVSWSPDGDIQVGNDAGPDYVAEYAYPYQSAPYANIISSAVSINSIVWTTGSDPSNNVIISDFFGNTIRVFAPPFTTPATPPTPAVTTITAGLDAPGGFIVDHQGNLWVGNSNDGNGPPYDYVTEYAAKTFQLIRTITPPFTVPNGFCCTPAAVSPDGTLVITSSYQPDIYIYTPPYTGAPVTLPVATGSYVQIDAADDILVENSGGAYVTAPPYATLTQLIGSGYGNCSMDDAGTQFCVNGTTALIYPKPWGSTPAVTFNTIATRTPMIIP